MMTINKSGKKITKSDISVPVTMMKPMNDGSVSFQKGKGAEIPFMDLQLEEEAIEEPAMTMQQYQDFLQAVAAFRKSIQATAMTAEKFVRALEDVTNYASKSKYIYFYKINNKETKIKNRKLVKMNNKIIILYKKFYLIILTIKIYKQN